MPHLPITGPLLELHPKGLKAGAGGLDVVDGDGDVAEALARLGVARGVALEVGVGLGAVVVRELEDALARAPGGLFVLGGSGAGGVVEGEEVEREVAVAVLCVW